MRSDGRLTIISPIISIQVNCMLRSGKDYDIRFSDNIHIDIDGGLDQRLGYFSRKLARSVWEIEWNLCVAIESFIFSMTVRCMALMISSYSMLFFWKWPSHCDIFRRIWFGFCYPNKEILGENSDYHLLKYQYFLW